MSIHVILHDFVSFHIILYHFMSMKFGNVPNILELDLNHFQKSWKNSKTFGIISKTFGIIPKTFGILSNTFGRNTFQHIWNHFQNIWNHTAGDESLLTSA